MHTRAEIEKVLQSGWIPYPANQLVDMLQQADPEVQECVITLAERIRKLSEISLALSAEHNLPRLLERIVDEARYMTHADGGTLYLVNKQGDALNFEIVHTDSLNVRMGGASGDAITWPPVPLYHDESPNRENVSAYVALTGETVNIPDVYTVDGFDFSGTRQFDKSTGYHSRSMLVIPMRNHEDEIIGVLQLLNKRDAVSGEVLPFREQSEDLIGGLASQAAIAISNTRLIHGLEELFESFIQVIAAAIDEKSPYTGGHIERVANLTVRIAEEINRENTGDFAETTFDSDEMKELRIAAWMHDIGKITTPEYVVDKATKLETIYDKIELIRLRYEVMKRDLEIMHLKSKLNGDEPEQGSLSGDNTPVDSVNRGSLENELQWIKRANIGSEYITDQDREQIDEIARRTYFLEGDSRNLLEPEEIKNLKIGRGTLNGEERQVIQNHAAVSRKMLDQLPYPRKLENIPLYAGAHHEKLNGTGYPEGLQGEEIPLQTRMMALADVFEALTAEDRPYKPGKKLSEAMNILGKMVEDNHLDRRIFELFIHSGLVREYANRYIKPEQVDCLEYTLEGKPAGESQIREESERNA